jgi:hypothetical protein
MSEIDPDTKADPSAGTPEPVAAEARPTNPLTPAAQRALAEAAARRADIDSKTTGRPAEFNGRGGLEPARYGDWEVKGIASDF